jgi:hypothetical protein
MAREATRLAAANANPEMRAGNSELAERWSVLAREMETAQALHNFLNAPFRRF